MKAGLKLFVAVYNDVQLLPHFLEHYRKRGVGHFLMAVVPNLVEQVRNSARDYRVTIVEDLDIQDIVGIPVASEMRARFQADNEWSVVVDLDEFVEADLRETVKAAEGAGANVVRGIMYDRFSVDGQPRPVLPTDDLTELFPIKSRFIREVMKGCDHKGVLVRGRLWPAARVGHHWFDGERAFSEVLEISHYKWTAGALERVRESLARLRAAHVSWPEEYERVLKHYALHGRFAWETFGGRSYEDFVPEPPAGHCVQCGAAISEAELKYSVAHFGCPLCRTDQRVRREAQRATE